MSTETISDHCRGAALRFLREVDRLGPVSRAALLHALLNLAFAEGAKSVVDAADARIKTADTINKARRTAA